MALSIGIVGLPNVGKSTLFNALTRQNVLAANYPFATIDPNVGVVAVPDERLGKLAVLEQSKKIVPTTIEFLDIAGLVKGASEGEGLGNKFLSHIREVDAIAPIVRFFETGDIHHVEGSIDPKRDIETIDTELILADLATIKKRLESARSEAKSGEKKAIVLAEFLARIEAELSSGTLGINIPVSEEEQFELKSLSLLTFKPVIYIANVSGLTADESKNILSKVPESLRHKFAVVDIKQESDLTGFSEEEKQTYLKEEGLGESGIDVLIRKAYETLGLITFLTTGPDETRAWTIRQGSRAPQAAGKIHTDFERGFIKAEVINWARLLEAGSWAAARDRGWVRTEGKEYVMQDGDVVVFKFNV